MNEHRFKVLLSGSKSFINEVRKLFYDPSGVHIQFVSSPRFIQSRALFTRPDIVFIDASHDSKQLMIMVENFRDTEPEIPILAVSFASDVRLAIELLKIGVNDYFVFPHEIKRLKTILDEILQKWKTYKQKSELDTIQGKFYDFSQIIGESQPIRELLKRARKIIDSNTKTILIVGETGTGKELLARAIHYNSPQSNCPFVDIGCSTISEHLLESELFGHEKGSFTDAHDRKIGLFELAGDGTIFLDEIGDITPSVQSKLLKAIESRVIRRVGGTKDVAVKARIIAATSMNLELKVLSGEFRRDLYHRLKIIPLILPPLRERKEDIRILTDYFIKQYNELYNKKIKGVSRPALQALMQDSWEGNIRELKHSIERAVLIAEDEIIGVHELELERKYLDQDQLSTKVDLNNNSYGQNNKRIISLVLSLNEASIKNVQKELIKQVLNEVDGNKSQAASILKISRPRLSRLLK
jgi:two-component system, NtrC family, response regulator AtoC